MPKYQSASLFSAGEIDSRAGVIYGVSVITEGEAKGHNEFVDAITIRQVKKCAEAFSAGLKVVDRHTKASDSVFSTVGFLQNFRIDGDKLRADLHLLSTDENGDKLMEMAKKIPDTFGLSISFSGPEDIKNGTAYARCTEIYNAALVDMPAANPDGLYSAQTEKIDAKSKDNKPMNPEEFAKLFAAAFASAMAPTTEKLNDLAAKLAKYAEAPAAPPKDAGKDSGKPAASEDDASDDEDDSDDEDEEDDTDEDEDEDSDGEDDESTDMKALVKNVKKLAARVAKVNKSVGKKFSAQKKLAREMAREFSKSLGTSPAIKPSVIVPEVKPPTRAENFETAVKTHFANTKSRGKATELAIRDQPEGYKEFILSGKKLTYT